MSKVKHLYIDGHPIIEVDGHRFCAIELKRRMNYHCEDNFVNGVDIEVEISAYVKEEIKRYKDE